MQKRPTLLPTAMAMRVVAHEPPKLKVSVAAPALNGKSMRGGEGRRTKKRRIVAGRQT